MDSNIIFYTIHCGSCKALQHMMDARGIKYTINTNEDEMRALGMKSAPGLMVDGKLMNFNEARNWIKSQD